MKKLEETHTEASLYAILILFYERKKFYSLKTGGKHILYIALNLTRPQNMLIYTIMHNETSRQGKNITQHNKIQTSSLSQALFVV